MKEALIYLLNQANLLNDENITQVSAYLEPYYLARALHSLLKAEILTQENFSLVAIHPSPSDLSGMFCGLARAEILTEENRALVAAYPDYYNLHAAMDILAQSRIMNQTNWSLVAAHPKPKDFAYAISRLQQADILTPENRDLVAAHANLRDLGSLFYELSLAGILTQENFTTLLTPNHAALVSDQARQWVWSRIPTHLLTQANFQRLLTAAEHAHPIAELQRVRDQILGIQVHAGAGYPPAFNPGQSTHTASVHGSVSASAAKLMQSYGEGLHLDEKIDALKALVASFDDSFKHQAAKRCIERITAADYHHLDSVSGVTTRQLLALIYIAIHDDSKRSGLLEDAKSLLMEGLYEIQRGYNLNADNQDNEGSDLSICVAGTFNKLIEKLNGIHSDVEVYYITHAGAASKFVILAQAHAKAYLQTLTSPETTEDYSRMKDLLEELKTDGSLEPIWQHIKAGVQTELWDEFKAAYSDDSNHPQFVSIVENGHYLSLQGLAEIESALLASSGYQAYLDAQRLHGLWSNRHVSSKAQEDFDKQYGLVLKP